MKVRWFQDNLSSFTHYGEFPTTKISSMPLRIHDATNVVQTASRCGNVSRSCRYSVIPRALQAVNKLATTPTVTPASTSALSLCRPVEISVPATRRSRKDTAKELIVPQNKVFSRYKCACC